MVMVCWIIGSRYVHQGARLSCVVAEPREGERFPGGSPRGRDGGPPPRRGRSGRGGRGGGGGDSSRFPSSSYGGPPPRERVRERSTERYDKYASDRYANDRYDDRRPRYDEPSSYDRRRGGGGSDAGNIVNELKNMLTTLVNSTR